MQQNPYVCKYLLLWAVINIIVRKCPHYKNCHGECHRKNHVGIFSLWMADEGKHIIKHVKVSKE